MTFTEMPIAEPGQLRERRAGTLAIVVLAYLLGQRRVRVVRYRSADARPGSYYDVIGPAEF